MENKITYNAKNFYSIKLKDSERDFWIEYIPPKKRIFGNLKPEHYKCEYMTPSSWNIKDHENTHFINEDHEVFRKPCVIITINTDNYDDIKHHYYYFSNFNETEIYYKEIIASLKKQRIKFVSL